MDIASRYQRAEKFLAWNLAPQIGNTRVQPYWINDSQCVFERKVKQNTEVISLNINDFNLSQLGESSVESVIVRATSPLSLSTVDVIVRDFDLYLINPSAGTEQRLTKDGERNYAYGSYPAFIRRGICQGDQLAPSVLWSPCGRYIVTQRIDERQVKSVPLLQSVPHREGGRPESQDYRLALPGDTHVPTAALYIVDTQAHAVVFSGRPAMPASNGGPMETGALWWGSDSIVYSLELSRDSCTHRLIVFDPVAASSRVVLEESAVTSWYPGAVPFERPVIKVVPETNDVFWYSFRSGWGQLYRYALDSGKLKHALTDGAYVVTWIHHIDIDRQRIIFSACGREPDVNPYYESLYRIDFDGSHLQLLTPEPLHHDINRQPPGLQAKLHVDNHCVSGVSPAGDVFIDTYGDPETPSKTVLRSTDDGAVLMILAEVDIHPEIQSLYTPPIGFTAKAADKSTDLRGVIYRPSDFNPQKTYPVILSIYGTPHMCITPKQYGETANSVLDTFRVIAELGFIVVMLDPRGTPLRSKAFWDVAYSNLQNGGGINDQVAVLKQLGDRHPWFDITRVGIVGHSGGGYAAARAMMTHPDFFSVGVASAGNHDLRLNVAGWGESLQGLVSDGNYTETASQTLSNALVGKLLLVHGDMDANVHIAHSLQLVNRLIDCNKDFDFLVLPNRQHVYANDTYFIRRVWDYFVLHLLHDTPPKNYAITPPTVAKEHHNL